MRNQITLQQATDNAKEAVAIQQELSKPAYPEQSAEPSVFERIAAFFTGKKSPALLREEIELETARLHGLDDRASAKKHAQQEAYTVSLAEVDRWRDTEAADCKASIIKLKSQLRLIEATQEK